MSANEPLVGVVVPVYNVGRWLDPMLSSLRDQTFTNWAAVVVDDRSDDDSLEVGRRHAALDQRITVVSNPHEGPGARLARIHGRSLLPDAADYLYFPDGDDVLEPLLIERLVERLESRPDGVAAFSSYSTIDEHGDEVVVPIWERPALTRWWVRGLADTDDDTPFASLYSGAPAWEGFTMFRRNAYDEAGGFEQSPAWASHTVLDLLLRMTRLGRVLFVAEALYRRRLRPGQMSTTPGLLVSNGRALAELWEKRTAADPDLRGSFAQAAFLLDHRATPRRRLLRAATFARRGNLVAAAPRVAKAALEYRVRIPPGVRDSLRRLEG